MTKLRNSLSALALLAAIAALPPTAASAATRAPIKDCGDISTLDSPTSGGFFLGAVTAQGGTCTNARAIARAVTKSAGCKTAGRCSSHGYRCALAKAGKELTLVRCENAKQTAFVRFEFGS